MQCDLQDEYVPHEHVTVDEAMVPFKGCSGFKQFMKDKPVKYGIKLWLLADAVTAYCCNLESIHRQTWTSDPHTGGT